MIELVSSIPWYVWVVVVILVIMCGILSGLTNMFMKDVGKIDKEINDKKEDKNE